MMNGMSQYKDSNGAESNLIGNDLNPFNIFSKVGNFLKKTDNKESTAETGRFSFSNKSEKCYYDDILPNGNYENTVQFLQKVVEMMYLHIQKSNQRNEKILNFYHPHELKKIVNLDIPKEPMSLDEILNDCQTAMTHAIKTGHPRFFNQLSQGLDLISLAGEWVTATTNTNMFTYEIAPLYNLIEEVTLDKMREKIGWKEPCDGLFNPGGTISNLYAVQTARHYFYPNIKDEGLFNMPKLVVFASEHSHYSVDKALSILGIGKNQFKRVPVDERGKLRPDKLEDMIKESIEAKEVPFMVILTAGTTVFGAYDPIEPVSKICKIYKLWLHIDAAWGGASLLSTKHRNLMKGIEEADSVTWNPHKLMGALLQSSAFLVKKKGILLSCNECNASYLFQQDKHYDVAYDTGDKTIQCGRHVDVFKVWLMWRAKGDNGFEKHVDKLFYLAQLMYEELKTRKNFEIVLENPEMTNICFWYIPESISHMDRKSDEFKKKLNEVAPQIKEKMMLKGSLMVSYQPLDDKPNFFRSVLSNNATTEDDIYFMIEEIENLGRNL